MFRLATAALFCLSLQTPIPEQTFTGRVVDPSGAPIAGAAVRALARDGAVLGTAATAADGTFALAPAAAPEQMAIAAPGFVEQFHATARLKANGTYVLDIAGVHEAVSVEAAAGYRAERSPGAMRTPTPLRDTPQAVSVVTRALIDDQAMLGIGDVVRYMPGVGIAQGEGNRDTPVLRGNATTADFFVDGVRDDVQYMRDLYNVERVEAIKGPNAMIFGRGGAGGIINRVTRQAGAASFAELTMQAGSWNHRRVTGDAGAGFSRGIAARITGVFEDSESYRQGAGVRRYGINPTIAFRPGARTTVRAGYEFFHDERAADRGVPSLDGRPLDTDPSLFFGDAARSPVRATINVGTLALERGFARGGSLRNRVSFGVYEKFYQNVFPGSVNATAGTVQIQAYNNATDRRNVFNQTDLVLPFSTGRIGHTLLAGAEIGRQVTSNVRNTGYFTALGPSVTSVNVALSNPAATMPIDFRPSATDADNHGVATTAAVYVQDQVTVLPQLDVVAGLRFDRFHMDFTNNRNGQTLDSTDGLWSPRAGLIYRPARALALYGSYSLSYVPRAGEQLSSLNATNRSLDPEKFINREMGATWDVTPSLALTAAVYQLDRGNVAVVDPSDSTRTILVDGQRTRGLEAGVTGHVTAAWTLAGGYALQEGEITYALSPAVPAGASLAQLPRHSFSLWNKYQVHPRVAAALGLIHRGESFTSTDNRVVLPSFTRADAALFVDVTGRLRVQLNAENLFDARYFASAHSNTNITPGSPRAVRASVVIRP